MEPLSPLLRGGHTLQPLCHAPCSCCHDAYCEQWPALSLNVLFQAQIIGEEGFASGGSTWKARGRCFGCRLSSAEAMPALVVVRPLASPLVCLLFSLLSDLTIQSIRDRLVCQLLVMFTVRCFPALFSACRALGVRLSGHVR